jgi:hypothetical protein
MAHTALALDGHLVDFSTVRRRNDVELVATERYGADRDTGAQRLTVIP